MTETDRNHTGRRDGTWRDILILLLGVCGFHLVCNVAFLIDDVRPPHYDPSDHFQISMRHYREITATVGGDAPWSTLPLRIVKVNEYYPPLFYLTAAPFYALGGISFPVARAVNTVYLFMLIFAVYGIGTRLYNPMTGLLSAAVISLYPIVFGLSRDFYPDLALLAWVAATVYFLVCTDGLRRTRLAVLFGAAFGLGQLTKQPFAFFAIGPCVYYFLQSTFPPRRLFGALGIPLRLAGRSWALPAALLAGVWLGILALRPGGGDGLAAKALAAAEGAGAVLLLVVAGILARREWRRLALPAEARASAGAVWLRIGNTALAAVVAFAIAGPYYLINWETVSSKGQFVVTQAGVDRGMASPAEAVFDYAKAVVDKQIQPLFAILLFLGLAAYPRRLRRSHGFLIVSFLAAYAIMSAFRTKDPRYTMPFLYALAPLSVAWIAELPSAGKRAAATAVVIGAGAAQCLMFSFGWGGYPDVLRETRLGAVVRVSPYGSAHGKTGDWGNRAIVADIQQFVAHDPGERVRTTTLFDTDYLRFATLRCEAMTEGLPLEFDNPRDDLADDYARRLYELSLSDCVLTKSGFQGEPFTLRAITDLREEFEDPESNIRSGFSLLRTYDLPDGSTARLWVRRDRTPGAGPPQRALPVCPLDYGDGVRFAGAVVDAAATRLGERLPVYLAWHPERELPADLACFIQLRDDAGSPVHSEQVDLREGRRVPVEGLGEVGLLRYDVYLNPDSGAAPGNYQAVLILMNPATGSVRPPLPAAGGDAEIGGGFRTVEVWWDFEPATPSVWRAVDRVRATIPPESVAGDHPAVQSDGVVLLGGIELRGRSTALPGQGMLFN